MESVLISFLNYLGHWLRPYQYQTALAIIATLLVIFGNDINNVIKKFVGGQHFIIRTLVFILVCAFGYGLLTVWLTNLLAQQLANVSTIYLAPLIIFIFFVIGAYMQKKRHI